MSASEEELREMVKELADELAEYVEHFYNYSKGHPAMQRRYDRDMDPVLRARALLEK